MRVAEAEEKAEEELGRMEDEQDGVEEIAKTDVTPASGEAGRVEGWISGEVKGAMYQTYAFLPLFFRSPLTFFFTPQLPLVVWRLLALESHCRLPPRSSGILVR